MKWTKERPTEVGFYWVRNFVFTKYPEYGEIPEATIICINGNGSTFMPAKNDAGLVAYGEFYGPITPPPEED